MPATALKSLPDLEAEVLEAVSYEESLHPGKTAAELAVLLLENNRHKTLCLPLSRILMQQYLMRAILTYRRLSRPKQETLPLFPGIEHLPNRIVTEEGKRPSLGKATATEIRAYVKTLNARHRDRIAGLQAVLKLMAKYITQNRGITAAEVAKLEAGSQ